MSDTVKSSLVAKLASIMGSIGHVEKRGVNEYDQYKYVKAADLAILVRKKLAEQHILMVSSLVSISHEAKQGKTTMMDYCRMTMRYTLIDGESGEKIEFDIPATAADRGDKADYKAMTGNLKYAIRNLFLVPDEASDPEADKKTDEEMDRVVSSFGGKILDVKKKGDAWWAKTETFIGFTRDEFTGQLFEDNIGKQRKFRGVDTGETKGGLALFEILEVE